MTIVDLTWSADPLGALIGLVVGLLWAPWSSMLIARPPFKDATEPLGLPFRCAECRQGLRWSQVVPFVSRIMQHGKCAHCSKPIPRIELINELLCAVTGAVAGGLIGIHPWLPALLVLSLVLVPMSVVDLATRKIATRLVYPTTAVVLVLLFGAAVAIGEWRRFGIAVVCGLVASAFMWVLWFVYPGGMGDGDARLALLLGLGTGWFGWQATLLGIGAGFVIGSLVGLGYGIVTKKYLKAQLPFGPWLGLGAALLLWLAP
jgi:leader peptidase (prepilin peptidase) / N-methyltransferase